MCASSQTRAFISLQIAAWAFGGLSQHPVELMRDYPLGLGGLKWICTTYLLLGAAMLLKIDISKLERVYFTPRPEKKKK